MKCGQEKALQRPKVPFDLSGYFTKFATERIIFRDSADPSRLEIRRTEEEEPSRREPVRSPDGR